MAYNLRSSSKMDSDSTDQDKSDSAPPWLAQLQLQLQQQIQQQHEYHQRDIELLRQELQEQHLRVPTSDRNPTSAATEPGALAETTAHRSVEPASPAADAHSADIGRTSATLGESSNPTSNGSAPATSTAAGTANAPVHARLQPDNTARRPPVAAPVKLSSTATLREFRIWRSSWNDYYRLGNIYTLSQEDQLAYLRACFTDDMRAASMHAVGICPHSDNVNSSLDKIERHLRLQHNVAIDRVKFEERQQEEGESFDSFLIAIKELAADAELCPSCLDERVTTRIMSGTHDKETKRPK